MNNLPINQNNNISFPELLEMAKVVAKSGLFAGINSPDQAASLMLLCQAEGLHPATVMRDFHFINGKPSLKADAMLSRFQFAGGKVQWIEYKDEVVTGEFYHPQGGKIVVSWDAERCRKAGLNSQNHQKYPRAMKRARVISEAIRTVFPSCLSGFYAPEEVEDFTTITTTAEVVKERVTLPDPIKEAKAFMLPEKEEAYHLIKNLPTPEARQLAVERIKKECGGLLSTLNTAEKVNKAIQIVFEVKDIHEPKIVVEEDNLPDWDGVTTDDVKQMKELNFSN